VASGVWFCEGRVLCATILGVRCALHMVLRLMSNTITPRRFYHQLYRKCLTGPADFVVDDVLMLSRRSFVSRYARIVLTFSISGLIHHFGEAAAGVPIGERGQFVFFTSQAFGIMLEDTVMELYTRFAIRRLSRGLEFTIAYVWLLAWLTWTVPAWFYPFARHTDSEKDNIVFGLLYL
jgi:hypothetical protein